MSESGLTQVQYDQGVQPCRNPECENTEVEIDQDGDHLYFECEECGFAFGYEKVEPGVRVEGNCSIGVPESVRRAASAPTEKALADQARTQPVDLGLSIGRRPSD